MRHTLLEPSSDNIGKMSNLLILPLKIKHAKVKLVVYSLRVPLALVGLDIEIHIVLSCLPSRRSEMIGRHLLVATSAVMIDVARGCQTVDDALTKVRLHLPCHGVTVGVVALPLCGDHLIHDGVHVAIRQALGFRRRDVAIFLPVNLKLRVLLNTKLRCERQDELRLHLTPFRELVIDEHRHVRVDLRAVGILTHECRVGLPLQMPPLAIIASLDPDATIFSPTGLVVFREPVNTRCAR